MGVVERGERQRKRRPGARGITLGACAERGKSAIQFDTRAEQQHITLEGREAEHLTEPLQRGGLSARSSSAERPMAQASVRRFVAGGAGGPTALHMPLQRDDGHVPATP